ncbi:MAG: c-type cytochrome [Gammaproteobacteria bacterium]|nr:c-type cytochrome [Gammaproteobacteria bacterium]MBV9619950.1 c-type cytochrome [Gammaproteobacteria bacterium]
MSTPPPLGYLSASGARADIILPLTWYTLIVSVVVCVVIGALLWQGVRRAAARVTDLTTVPPQRGASGLSWIRVGVGISLVPLLVALVWTVVALGAASTPAGRPALVLDITGHQWWWEVTYAADEAANTFTTANEIHIPVGAPVLVRLHAADVIHSFWVPKLTGKTDTIPGQTNLGWIQARRAGHYRGQCTEYCGWQHAHMGLEIIADPPAEFARWRARQLQPAPQAVSDAERHGRALLEFRCGSCHAVRGTTAGARSAPDLSHLAGRHLIGAAVLTNGAGALGGWIENPQGLKPGCLMPNQGLSVAELNDVVAYLEKLQ